MRRGNTARDTTQLDQKKDHADGGQVLMNITKYGQAVYHIKEMGVYGVLALDGKKHKKENYRYNHWYSHSL